MIDTKYLLLKEVTTNEELTDIEEINFIDLPKSK